LWTASATAVSSYRDAFADGLRQLGYVEGRDVTIEHRYAEDRIEALPGLVGELLRAGVDVVVAQGTPAARAAKQATATVPIIMVSVGDPVRAGLVASLARPGGNVTGVTVMVGNLAVKQLEVLKEAVPGLKRVGILYERSTWAERPLAGINRAASILGIATEHFAISGDTDLGRLFQGMAGLDAIMVLPGPVIDQTRGRIGELAVLHRLPSIGAWRFYADAGLLFSYSASLTSAQGRAAAFVDKILKGANPGDLPIEQPTRFELVVNLNTAWALGLAIPPALLARADAVIE
jgi:putative ABC transport system substrate-binding protein